MANNAIFARLANLWTGFISLWVSDVEKEHPEIAYQNAIASMIEKVRPAQGRHRRHHCAPARHHRAAGGP
jgi:hypothetical protein